MNQIRQRPERLFFYLDGDSFMVEKGFETYQIGDVINSMIDMWNVDTCDELYGKGAVTKEDLEQAVQFAVRDGYLVQCSPEP